MVRHQMPLCSTPSRPRAEASTDTNERDSGGEGEESEADPCVSPSDEPSNEAETDDSSEPITDADCQIQEPSDRDSDGDGLYDEVETKGWEVTIEDGFRELHTRRVRASLEKRGCSLSWAPGTHGAMAKMYTALVVLGGALVGCGSKTERSSADGHADAPAAMGEASTAAEPEAS